MNDEIRNWVLKERPFIFHLILSILTFGIWIILYFLMKLQAKIPTSDWNQIVFAKVWINKHENKIKINNKIYNFNDIIGYELLEDGNSIIKSDLGSMVGRAAVGSLINPVGAIIGGVTGKKTTSNICTKLEIKVTVNNINKPCQYINFINSKTKKSSSVYKQKYEQAQKTMSILNIINN